MGSPSLPALLLGSKVFPLLQPRLELPHILGLNVDREGSEEDSNELFRKTIAVHEAWITLISLISWDALGVSTEKPDYSLLGLTVHMFNRFADYSVAWRTGTLDHEELGRTYVHSQPGLMTDAELRIARSTNNKSMLIAYTRDCAEEWLEVGVQADAIGWDRPIIDSEHGVTNFVSYLGPARRHAIQHFRQLLYTLDGLGIAYSTVDVRGLANGLDESEAIF